MQHFTRADLLLSLAAVGGYALLLVTPGYVVGWAADLFGFRRRTGAFRAALSIPLSIAILPIAIYVAGRFGSWAAAEGLIAATWASFAVLVWRHGWSWPRVPRMAWVLVAGWLALTLLISVDLQMGTRDYYPVTAFDYAVRSEFIHSIGTTGVPPASPFFYPGHAVTLRYHYFWLLLPGLVYRASGLAISPRAAWFGGTFWCGLGLMCLVAVFLRVFWNRGSAGFSRRAIGGILLLTVTGLDILPTAVLWLARASGIVHAILPSMEWWNEQVDGFVYTALWEAHHLAGLIACLVAFLLIQEGPRRPSYAVIAGVALATATGASLHIAFVFAIYLVVWLGMVVAKRWWREAVSLAITGGVALALALPNALTLRGTLRGTGEAGGMAAGTGAPVEVWVRAFLPLEGILHGAGVKSGWVVSLADLAALPLNYFLELGFFGVAGAVWWRKRRAAGGALTRGELALAVLVATSMVVCTFLRSSLIGNNDLGWRGFLPAQFGLLLWAVDVVWEQPRRKMLSALLVLGVMGTFYDAAILRLFPIMGDAGVVKNPGWMAPDHQLGVRNYLAREAYEWIARSTPASAVVQFDPHTDVEDTSAFLYAQRQIAAADTECLMTFGGEPADCRPLIERLTRLYPAKGKAVGAGLAEACRELPVDVLVAKDTDAAWADSQGWVWKERPVFANGMFRVFRCR